MRILSEWLTIAFCLTLIWYDDRFFYTFVESSEKIRVLTCGKTLSQKGTTAVAPVRCNPHVPTSDWNCCYFYTLHSILFTILVCDSLNCGYYVQVGYVPASLEPNTQIQRYSRNDGEAFSENSAYPDNFLGIVKNNTKPRLTRYWVQ